MADKYDLVIFGSAATARVLALSLTREHKARVLLIVNPEQSHRLPATPQISAGFCTSPTFFERLSQGAVAAQRMLATLKLDQLASARPTAIFARFPQHMPLIEFAEGAAIHAGIVSERRIHPDTQTEQLVFPESLSFDNGKIIEACDAHNLEAAEYTIFSRDDLIKSHITQDGRFSGRTENESLKADRVLLLDQDLIQDELQSQIGETPLVAHVQNVIRFGQRKQMPIAAQQDISTGLWQFETNSTDLLFSAPGQLDQLATHLFKHHNDIADRRVRQMDYITLLNAQDGYPVCDVVGPRNAICFAGAQHFEFALVTELANQTAQILAGDQHDSDPFWQNARIGKKRAGDGTLLRAEWGGVNE